MGLIEIPIAAGLVAIIWRCFAMSAWKWIKTAASVGTGGMSSLYLYGGLLLFGAALAGGAAWWHAGKVDAVRDAAFKAGQADVQGRWDKAVSEAKDAQAQQNEQATDQFTTEVEVVKTVYVDRIKEIKTYVPSPGTSCPADSGFLQRYNAPASPAGDTADQ